MLAIALAFSVFQFPIKGELLRGDTPKHAVMLCHLPVGVLHPYTGAPGINRIALRIEQEQVANGNVPPYLNQPTRMEIMQLVVGLIVNVLHIGKKFLEHRLQHGPFVRKPLIL